jgi:hypothetical protein
MNGVNVVDVELDIFSGRPNPHWSLSPDQQEQWLAQLRTASVAQDEVPILDGLGYRGFLVINGQEEVRVFKGRVFGFDLRQLLDSNRSIERWLFETGRPSLPSNLIEIVTSALH